MIKLTGDMYWIGLSDEIKEGTFVWGDGSKLDYTNWLDGEPNDFHFIEQGEDCVLIRKGEGWNDMRCSFTAPFVCQYSGF